MFKNDNHLDDSVLWWPATLPLEHGVNTGGHGHGDGLHPLLRHVPLLGVLVDLVVVQPSEGDVRAQDDLGAVFLKQANTNIFGRVGS